MVYGTGQFGSLMPVGDVNNDPFSSGFENINFDAPMSQSAGMNFDIPTLGNTAAGNGSFGSFAEGMFATEGSPLIAQMGAQGGQFDTMIAQQEALLPGISTQLFSLQLQAAQNPELRAALYPMINQLREQQRGIQQLVDARLEMMEGINAVYKSMEKSVSTATGNIKSAANSLSGLSAMIGDIDVGNGGTDS